MRASLAVLVFLLLLLGPAAADDKPKHPSKFLMPRQAADKVMEVLKAKDEAALKELAQKDEPDPWLVADELCSRGEHDAAQAFAEAAPREAIEKLPAYVASRRGREPNEKARKALALMDEALAAEEWQVALEAAAEVEGPLESVVPLRAAYGRGLALGGMDRHEDSAKTLAATGTAAHALGWLARASSAFHGAARRALGERDARTTGNPTLQDMKDDMRRRMGPYTPRELYPSLMQLPELSTEERAEIKRQARQRMEDGLQLLTTSRTVLAAATERNDLSGMQQAADDMRAGVAGYESGLAALRALEAGKGPREVALRWFRREMSLDAPNEPNSLILGMTPFHAALCALLVLFASAMIWMYVLRMRRAAALLYQLSQPPTFSDEKRAATSFASLSTREDSPAVAKPASWGGALRVASIYAETPDVKTFRFVEPADGAIPFQYSAGQFLRLVLEIDGNQVKRAYTIASTPTRNKYIEITVKREKHGLVSQYLHEQVKVGDVLNFTAPAGSFTFAHSEHDSIVLIGGGVGVTPLMSVVRALTDIGWDNEIYFILAYRTRQDFIFREELSYLQGRNPHLRLLVTFSRETGDIEGFHRGRITKELIARSVPRIERRRIHLCGSPPMAGAVKKMLAELGVPSSEIKFEAFGTIKRKPGALDSEKGLPQEGSPSVTFSLSTKSGPLASGVTVLEAAEAIGVDIDNACRSGTCGSCKVRLESGTVTMDVEDALAPNEKDAGVILACQAKSDAHVEVEA